jgi:hypothetical protein
LGTEEEGFSLSIGIVAEEREVWSGESSGNGEGDGGDSGLSVFGSFPVEPEGEELSVGWLAAEVGAEGAEVSPDEIGEGFDFFLSVSQNTIK